MVRCVCVCVCVGVCGVCARVWCVWCACVRVVCVCGVCMCGGCVRVVCACGVCVVRWSGVNRSRKFTVSSNTICKLPQDGVLTPKHVGVILIQIYTTYLRIRWYNNKH